MAWLADRLITRRSLLKTAGAAGAAATVAGVAGCGKKATTTTKLAIVYTNDTHGHDLLDEESLGLAAAVQLRSDYEAQGYEVLLLDAGDAVQGTSMVNRSRGENAIEFLNTCGYDAMCLGNHEFDFGQDALMSLVAQAHFPVVSANVIVDATDELLVEPRTILTLSDGTKVGVFGLCTPSTYTTTSPLLVQGLTFLQGEELYACAQRQADTLRAEGCGLVVCLAHLGEGDANESNRAIDVAANTKGIDLFIDAHDHEEENQKVPNADGTDVLIVEAGCYTHAVGVVTWENGELTSKLEAFGTYEGQDATVAASIKKVADEVEAELSEVIGSTPFLLDGQREPGVRTKETNLGDFAADAIMWESQMMADDQPDCAILNGGGIRASIPAGEITLGDILNMAPFTNYICTIQVSGAQLLEALEAAVAYTPDQMGSFPQMSNMSITIDTRVPYAAGETYPQSTFKAPADPGSRVTIHDVGGRGFELDKTYTVAATDFMCMGGDSYHAFADAAGKTMKTIGYLMCDCVQYYLQEACNGEVPEEYADPAGQGRIEVVS